MISHFNALTSWQLHVPETLQSSSKKSIITLVVWRDEYSIVQKNPNTLVSFFIFKKYFGIFFLILINELCKTINSTHNMKSWKLKNKKYTLN
jgi:hypothetical protein